MAKEVNQVATHPWPQPHSYSLLCYFSLLLGAPPPPRPLPRYPPKFTLSVFHTTYFYASFERGYVFFFTFSRLDFSLTENIVLLREPLRPKAPLGADYMIRDLIGSDSSRLPIVIGRLK